MSQLHRIASVLSVVLALAFASGAAFAQPAPPAAPQSDPDALTWESLQGDWKIAYWDAALDGVRGWAKITDQDVRVTLRHPETGTEQTLAVESAEIQGNEFVLTFGAGSPKGARQKGLGYPDVAVRVDSPDISEVTITGGTEELTLPLAPFPETDIDRVEVRLERNGPSTMTGEWRYRVHPFIARAKDGFGRAGHLEQDEDGVWWAVGGEGWSRLKPKLFGAVAIQDQLAKESFSDGTSMPYYGYPFGSNGDGEGETRTLFVFGKDLPREWGNSYAIEGKSPGVTYVEVGRLSDYRRREERRAEVNQSSAADDRASDPFTRGRELVKARLKPEQRGEVEDLEAVIVRATLARDMVPGWQRFSYGGSEAAWLLQFGDNTATLRIVRKIGRLDNEHERASYLFSGEMVRVEIETTQKLPVKSIPVVVGSASPGGRVDPNAKKGLLKGDGEGIAAIRSPDNPRIYRTEFIRVDPRLPAGQAIEANNTRKFHTLPGGQGTRIFATIGKPGIVSLPPTMAQATVFNTAGDTAVGGKWSRWLSAAATCAGVQATTRVATERAEADTISEFLINSGVSRFPIPGWMESKVTVGQHAGMLLMRDTFVRRLLHSQAMLNRIQSEAQVLAFRRSMEPLVRQGATPLTRIEVKGPDGIPTEFRWTFEKAIIGDIHDKEKKDVEKWAIDATREAIGIYRQRMEKAILRARDLEDCDVGGLLKLTGYEFDTVAKLAQSKMMVPAPAPLYWAPDYRARAQIETVKYVGEQVEIQEKLGEADRREAAMAVGLATIPVAVLGGWLGSSAAIVATFTVDVIDIGMATYAEIDDKLEKDAELEFALAAADVTGMRRLVRAEARQRSWASVMGKLFPQVVFAAYGAIIDVPDIYKAFGEGLRLTKAARGRALLMEANNLPKAADAAPARASDVAAELDESLDRVRAAQAAGEAVEAPTLPTARPGEALDPELAAAAQPRPRGVRFDDLPDALEESADDIFRYLDDLDGSDALSEIDDAFLSELDRVAGRIGDGADRPGWASALSEENFQLVRDLANRGRADIVELMEEGGAAIARQLQAPDPTRARYAREVLMTEPGVDLAKYEELVDGLVKRHPEPQGERYFSQADPANLDITDDLAEAGWKFTLDQDGTTAGYLIRDPDGHVGSVQRAFDPATGEFKMEAAFREAANPPATAVPGPIRGMIEDVLPQPLTPKGVPAIQYATMRVMNHLGVKFGTAGAGGIRKTTMVHIANYATIIKLEYLRRLFHPNVSLADIPPEELSKLLMMTHSVRYGESVLAASGYKVTGARIELDALGGEAPMRFFHRNFYSSTETAAEFAARHGFDDADEGMTFFNIVLDVEPF